MEHQIIVLVIQMNEETYNELCTLRERLKRITRTESGRVATICTDRAIESIAEYEPRTLDEMRTLDGVSKDFVDRHGQLFLDVVNKNRVKVDKSILSYQMTDRQSSIIKELEKNLVDINRNNKLLYIAKSQKKYSQDVYSKDYDIRTLLFGTRQSITICDCGLHSDYQYRRYDGFSNVLREATRDVREKGRNDLYIGYPFVKGKLQGEEFEIRAPMALFPVKADRTSSSIKLSLDEDRDVLYNNTLILAHHKFNNIRKALPDPEIESFTGSNLFNTLIEHYREQGIFIKNSGEELHEFTDYLSGEFPLYEQGELYLENVAALGKFTMQTSSIHRDYDQIIESNEVNGLLYNLIDAYDIDMSQDVFYGDREIKEKKETLVRDKDIIYINDLNSSQERVLTTIEKTDELVIQGPPGTGKSQTIASLIIDSVNKGKTVLMVSEKKTALDVVYSRLGTLSKYAIQIDDIGDKERFYDQMDSLINLREKYLNDTDLSTLSDKIDERLMKLDELAKAIYSPNDFGIEPYQMLHMCGKLDPSNDLDYGAYRIVGDSPSLLELKYDGLNDAHKVFSNQDTVDTIISYHSSIDKHPSLMEFKKDLSDFDLRSLAEDSKKISSDVDAWNKKFFLMKILGKGSMKKEVGSYVDRYMLPSSKQSMVDDILKNGTSSITDSIGGYGEYRRASVLYETLTDTEKSYSKAMFSMSKICNDSHLINNVLYAQILNRHIDDFRKKSSYVIGTIDNFNNIVKEISDLTEEKKRMSIKHTDYNLYSSLYENVINPDKKGCKELRRKVESKRKKSVNLFIRSFTAQLFKGIKIWLMTPEVVSEIIPFEKGRFDLLIFDEASQMYREKGLPAIYRAKKVVIAGDDKQLRPTSVGKGRFEYKSEEDEDLDAALEETSLLDLAKAKYTPVLLNCHYRSKYEELINFSNYAFYRGRLYVSPNVSTPEEPPIKMHIVDGMWAERSNYEEAKKVVELVKEFFRRRRNNDTLGIITFNINQRDLIEDLLYEECLRDPVFDTRFEEESNRMENGEDVGLFIRSIENVQGDERDEIIFSIGYAKDSDGRFRRMFGSLSQEGGENRLNVAITRAKKKIQIVTSMMPEEFNVSGVKNKGPFFLRKYLEYSHAISECNKEKARAILLSFHDEQNPGSEITFDSPFEEEVYDALTERGLSIDTQVGIGGYSIDMAVKKNGKYILGIECDGKLYHSSETARERDYHRQKYLESRGWRIHRIWSTNWWNNRELEINNILLLVTTLS